MQNYTDEMCWSDTACLFSLMMFVNQQQMVSSVGEKMQNSHVAAKLIGGILALNRDQEKMGGLGMRRQGKYRRKIMSCNFLNRRTSPLH